jgi:hypothetical protein
MKISRKQQVNRRRSYKQIVQGGNPTEDYTPFLISFKVSSKRNLPASILFGLGYRYLWDNIKEEGNLIPIEDTVISNAILGADIETYTLTFSFEIDNEFGPKRFKKEYLAAIKDEEKKNPSGFNIKVTNFTIKRTK